MSASDFEPISELHPFSYSSGYGIRGQCLLQAWSGSDDNAVLVVACVQPPGYRGISIINAFEVILKEFLTKAEQGEFGKNVRDKLNEAWRRAEDSTRRSLLHDPVVWLQIFPPGTGVWGDRTAAQRVVLTETDEPVWSGLEHDSDLRQIAEKVVQSVGQSSHAPRVDP
jgi:hypothetical protein